MKRCGQKLFDSNWYWITWPAFGERKLFPSLGDQTQNVLSSPRGNQSKRQLDICWLFVFLCVATKKLWTWCFYGRRSRILIHRNITTNSNDNTLKESLALRVAIIYSELAFCCPPCEHNSYSNSWATDSAVDCIMPLCSSESMKRTDCHKYLDMIAILKISSLEESSELHDTRPVSSASELVHQKPARQDLIGCLQTTQPTFPLKRNRRSHVLWMGFLAAGIIRVQNLKISARLYLQKGQTFRIQCSSADS